MTMDARISAIQDAIAAGSMDAAMVFTKMREFIALQDWQPMSRLPHVTERTEMFFRKEWRGRDDKVHATHEVLRSA